MNHALDVLQDLGEQLERLAAEPRTSRRTWWPWHRRTISAVVVALVAASGAAAVTLTRGSSPPVAIYGMQLCPPSYPYVAASAPNRLVYPSDYPQRPIPESRGVTCFASLTDALDAGYGIAPTPAGDTKLETLYMQPAPRSVRSVCQRAEHELDATVYCPTRLPAPWVTPALEYECPTEGCGVPLLSLSGSFTAPDSYVGSAPGIGEVTIWQATHRQQRLYPYLVGCLGNRVRLIRHTTFRGNPGGWYDCSIFGGSTSSMLQWRHGNESYGVSADGPPALRQRVVEYIASHMDALS
jgi:hypothetical protein